MTHIIMWYFMLILKRILVFLIYYYYVFHFLSLYHQSRDSIQFNKGDLNILLITITTTNKTLQNTNKQTIV